MNLRRFGLQIAWCLACAVLAGPTMAQPPPPPGRLPPPPPGGRLGHRTLQPPPGMRPLRPPNHPPTAPAPNQAADAQPPGSPAAQSDSAPLPPLETFVPVPTKPTQTAQSEPPAPVATASASAPPMAHVAPSVATSSPITAPTDNEPARPADHVGLWGIVLLVALGVGWLMWRRGRTLAEEAQRLALQHRALKNVNHRLRNESDQLRRQAINDPLTGSLNRQAFAEKFRERVVHAAHYSLPVHLIILDLDHFKSINDRLGHLAGDSALKLVAGIVLEHLQSADLLGRFGGDEFLIACVERDTDQVRTLAESIRRAVEAAAGQHTPPLPGMTLSMGIAGMRDQAEDSADALFARADAALYEAKRSGRNRVVVANGETRGVTNHVTPGRHL